MRRVLPYVNRVSGALLLLAGAYVAYYGWYELRVFDGDTTGGGVAQWAFDLNSRVSTWITEVGPTRVGLLLALVIAFSVLVALARRSSASGRPVDGSEGQRAEKISTRESEASAGKA